MAFFWENIPYLMRKKQYRRLPAKFQVYHPQFLGFISGVGDFIAFC